MSLLRIINYKWSWPRLCFITVITFVLLTLMTLLFVNINEHVTIQQYRPPLIKGENLVNIKNISIFKNAHIISLTLIPQNNKLKPSILIYTPFFGGYPWSFVQKNYFNKCPCEYKCNLIYNRTQLQQSDVVIFHGRDMPQKLNDLHQRRPENQKWGYFILESPWNSPDTAAIGKWFDFSISMNFKSNYQWRPYGVKKLNYPKAINVTKNYAKGKTKHVAWFASNCVKHRISFATRLQAAGINVFVGGGCSRHFKNKLQPCNRGTKKGYGNCKDILHEFKFYFSAENGFCNDYITEKYYIQGLQGDTIPIVLGAGDYSNPKNAIPGSYINPIEFNNFQHFVDYLKMLDKNDTAYNEYFEWNSRWTSGWKKDNSDACASFICDICKDLHHNRSRLTGSQLNQQYSRNECKKPTEKFNSWYSIR